MVWAISPWNKSRVVILASSMRTGSTVFCGMAASLPDVESSYEALNLVAYGWMHLKGAKECADLVRDLGSQAPVTVIKVFPSHLTQAETNWFEFADALPEASWIHLYRHDVAAQYVSLVRAKSSRSWLDHKDAEASRVLPVEVDLDDLAAHFEENVAADREAHEALRVRRGYRLISYEEFQADPATWARRELPDLLGVPSANASVPYRRQGTERVEDGVTNPQALITAEQRSIRWHPAADW